MYLNASCVLACDITGVCKVYQDLFQELKSLSMTASPSLEQERGVYERVSEIIMALLGHDLQSEETTVYSLRNKSNQKIKKIKNSFKEERFHLNQELSHLLKDLTQKQKILNGKSLELQQIQLHSTIPDQKQNRFPFVELFSIKGIKKFFYIQDFLNLFFTHQKNPVQPSQMEHHVLRGEVDQLSNAIENMNHKKEALSSTQQQQLETEWSQISELLKIECNLIAMYHNDMQKRIHFLYQCMLDHQSPCLKKIDFGEMKSSNMKIFYKELLKKIQVIPFLYGMDKVHFLEHSIFKSNERMKKAHYSYCTFNLVNIEVVSKTIAFQLSQYFEKFLKHMKTTAIQKRAQQVAQVIQDTVASGEVLNFFNTEAQFCDDDTFTHYLINKVISFFQNGENFFFLFFSFDSLQRSI